MIFDTDKRHADYNGRMQSDHRLQPFSGKKQFATTRWTMVCAIGGKNSQVAASALQELCQTYWYPLYSFVRSQGLDADEAGDLTQAFFADLLQREDLKRVDPGKGRFRSYLLSSMKHFLLNYWDKQKAQKRGGGTSPLSLDFDAADSRYRLEPAHSATPEVIYQKEWARTLLDRVHQLLQKEFADRGQAFRYDKLKSFLAGKNADETMAAAAKQLEMSQVAVKVAVHRMRQRFGELIREEIAQTVSTPAEIDGEIQQLFEMLRN